MHRHPGPGFVELVYEEALAVELCLREIPFERQPALRVTYKGHRVGDGRPDLMVGGSLVVEVCPNNRGVENRPYLLLNGGAAEQVIPPTAKGPIAESIVDGLPRAKIGIQVAPGNTGSCQPHNRIDEIAIRTF